MSAISLSHLLLLLGVRRKKPKKPIDKQNWRFKCQGVIAKGALVKGKAKQ